ncbi:hypothetical protein FJT64_005563 [Amphibalanus amphitrite]|uniref:Uncharacterized protein n=1 Tax=Amphibalanus amphitrite TaxID=1232801 RepID=A0A6A4VQT2_AMPAM|nr:hypothetical protein FJT64_005563 [Amphibalanus amphitrite]
MSFGRRRFYVVRPILFKELFELRSQLRAMELIKEKIIKTDQLIGRYSQLSARHREQTRRLEESSQLVAQLHRDCNKHEAELGTQLRELNELRQEVAVKTQQLDTLMSEMTECRAQQQGAEAAMTTEGPNECACEIVAPEVEDYVVLYSFSSIWEESCDNTGEELCRKQCRDDSNALEENGGWMAPASEGDDMTIGDVACENLGRDETLGIESQLYSSVCDLPYHEEGHGIRDLLCCEDGLQVECLGPITTLPPML